MDIEKDARVAWQELEDALDALDKKTGARGIGNPFKSLTRKIRRAFEKLGDSIKSGIRKVGREVEELAKKAVKEVEAAGKKAVREVEEGVTEKLPDLMEAAARKLAEEAASGAAKKALSLAIDIIEGTQPDTYTIIFGIELALIVQGEVTVSLALPNPVGRLGKIKAWAEKPPSGRAKIIECVKDFGPESITAEAKVSGNGGSATWSGEKAYGALDSFLRKNGVS